MERNNEWLSQFNTDAIYEIVKNLLDDIDDRIIYSDIETKEKQLRNHKRIGLYLSELYLRNLWNGLDWLELDPLSCSICKRSFNRKESIYRCEKYKIRCYPCIKHKMEITILTEEEIVRMHKNDKIQKQWELFLAIKEKIKRDFAKFKRIKQYRSSIVESDISKEIHEKVDDILYRNGNNIQELKEHLSSEHYRFIRSGYDVSKLELQEQIVLMNRLALL